MPTLAGSYSTAVLFVRNNLPDSPCKAMAGGTITFW
jgi:hypothetical protein